MSMAADAVAQLNAALGEALKDDPAGAVRAHAAVMPIIAAAESVERAPRLGWVPAAWQVRLTELKTGRVVHDWRDCGKQAFDLAGGQPHQGSGLRCEYRVLYAEAPGDPGLLGVLLEYHAARAAYDQAMRPVRPRAARDVPKHGDPVVVRYRQAHAALLATIGAADSR